MPKSVSTVSIDVTIPICDLDGTPLPMEAKEGAPTMVLGHILIRTALQPPMEGAKAYTAAQQTARYNIAMDVHEALKQEPHTIEMEPGAIAELKEEIARFFAPAVAGPALRALDRR